MPGELSDRQIALLCDIGQASHYEAPEEREAEIDHLLRAGYLRRDSTAATLQLTAKASTFLSARGATLNEA